MVPVCVWAGVQAGAARPNSSFVWGVGAMLEDARSGAPRGPWVGGAAGWAGWCGCDVNSTEVSGARDSAGGGGAGAGAGTGAGRVV